MSSYKSEGGRIPRLKDPTFQRRNGTFFGVNSSSRTYGPSALHSRVQISKSMAPTARNSRSSSFSDAEEARGVQASLAASQTSSTAGVHMSLLPRANTHPSPSTATPLPSRHLKLNLCHVRPVLRWGPMSQNPLAKDHAKFCVAEHPQLCSPDHVANPTTQPSLDQAIPVRHKPSPSSSHPKTASKARAQPVEQGPSEFASLRTTVNTQNLPPPTPIFASASSPSTRYSGSPGIWSRTSTPTSLSSYSPGIIHSAKVGPRFRHPSPSESRLPIFSPIMQKSDSQDDPLDSAGDGFPGMTAGAGLSTLSTSTKNHFDNPPNKDGPAKRATPTGNQLPLKTSTKSILPRMTRPNLAENSESSEEQSSGAAGDHGNLKGSVLKGEVSGSGHVPSRPSREGTHRLELEPSPVIRSNLPPGAVASHRRHGSGASSVALGRSHLVSNVSAATSVDSLQSRSSARRPSLIPSSPESMRKSPRTLIKEPKTKQDATSPAKSRRYGLFSKKSNSETEVQKPEDRHIRKGPAAGTGHEGYGRYAQRGRKGTVGSNSDTRARSTSTNRSTPRSVSSTKTSVRGRTDMDLDDFLLDRLEPVFITGGGMDGASLTKTQSGKSTSGLSVESAQSLVKYSGSSSAGYSTDSLPAPTAENEQRNPYLNNSTQARLQVSNQAVASSSGLGHAVANDVGSGQASSRPSKRPDETPLLFSGEGSSGSGTATEQPKTPQKKSKGFKWSFFQRHGNAQKEKKPTREPLVSPNTPQLHATVSPVLVSRPVAHYALVDADSDPLEVIINHVEESPPTEIEDLDSRVEIPAALNIRKQSQSILLPSPPKLQGEFCRDRPASPKVYFNKDPLLPNSKASTSSGRPRRLASVGRIPEVISRRDRQHKPALQSFSRPFSMADSPSIAAPATDNLLPELQTSSQPTITAQSHGAPRRPLGLGFDLTCPFGDPEVATALNFISGPYSKDEFLTFSPRKDSGFSTSSGSEALAAVTAVVPMPGSDPTEDEVWAEYDDLIDHVLSPEVPGRTLPGESTEDGKLEMATVASKALQAEMNSNVNRHSPVILVDTPAVALTPSSPQPSDGSFHLRRSAIASALHSSITPSSQPSFSDIIASYCYDQDGRRTSNEKVDDNSASLAPVEQQAAFLSSSSLDLSETFETCRQRNTILFDIAERDREGPTAQTNIRSGSLMTSRWLSFGRVLFSPAHNHVKNGELERILVIDGLGNEDWSFYCALTYPNADIYCLTDGPAKTTLKHPAAWQPPTNHHTVHQDSLEQPFPFAKSFFTVTVLRFPSACSESVQNNIVSECKRVLRPGGYMEMSVLDLDMVNMGIRTRKAVRMLKEKTYLSDPSISLKPASDNLQKLLGLQGFDSLRRCMVRIPVTGVIVRSSASSSSTSSSNPSTSVATGTPSTAFSALTSSSTSAQLPKVHGKSPSNDTDLSLGDLLSDPSPSPSNDESIRKIVAKVGRWWYTRCYEIPVLPNGDASSSIWADKRVLRECQKRGTGFRLLIAYAQKPSEVKRRTASV
ncbi:uncharacterized protein P174DRAFT_447726 [Aspergillus novofumigatus IBT 16806]|uniref:Methyltransferase type 11 domain-containing protein n=1 Tax=Aspergillus novofumigatus (strain IBT 16806) TaxID=1392255 RepID=A0A2I1CNI4_ASPN1|nr:uncharacterized protein P174DRAFT_447726 [Aspergillus novofumigatus IBT 16806]PKX99190.1 hypothetical protein P174DRAFT_447726 [Aspergillus novofumigatus IBT 16806]